MLHEICYIQLEQHDYFPCFTSQLIEIPCILRHNKIYSFLLLINIKFVPTKPLIDVIVLMIEIR